MNTSVMLTFPLFIQSLHALVPSQNSSIFNLGYIISNIDTDTKLLCLIIISTTQYILHSTYYIHVHAFILDMQFKLKIHVHVHMYMYIAYMCPNPYSKNH